MTVRERRILLAVLGSLAFASVYTTVVMAPVLTQIALEFGVSPGTAGLVVAAYAAPGIPAGILSGPYSDRFGRKRFLFAGALVMGVFTLLGAFATSFGTLVVLRALAGAGAAITFPNITAMVADNFPYRDRGRAMSTVVGFNTMASIIGVPIAGIVAEATSWRASVAIVGGLSILAAALLLVTLGYVRGQRSESGALELYRLIARSRSALAVLSSSFLGSVYWFTWATFIVVFFELIFGLSRGNASTFAITLGLGVFFGSQLGGRIGDRIGHKRVVGGSIVISGALLLVLTNLPMPLIAAAVLNLVVSAVIGARFATNLALMSEQVPEARGTMVALSSATVSVGILIAALSGGALIDAFGFWALGIFCAGAAVASALILALFVREEPIDLEVVPA